MSLTRDHVAWACRVLLDREPTIAEVDAFLTGDAVDTAALRTAILTSDEFADRNTDLVGPCRSGTVLVILPGGTRVAIDVADRAIGWPVAQQAFEVPERAFARRQVRPGDSVVDGGAHVGVYTVELAQLVGPTGHVLAVEPHPGHVSLLEHSVRENGFGGRIRIAAVALGRADGQGRLHCPPWGVSSAAAYTDDDKLTPSADHTTEPAMVSIRSLDTLVTRRPLSFMKLDIEGAEGAALAGAADVLRHDRPVIACEIHHQQLRRSSGQSAEDVFRTLAAFGYRPHAITADGRLGPRLDHPPVDRVSTLAFVRA